jgi:hypothetical protein
LLDYVENILIQNRRKKRKKAIQQIRYICNSGIPYEAKNDYVENNIEGLNAFFRPQTLEMMMEQGPF